MNLRIQKKRLSVSLKRKLTELLRTGELTEAIAAHRAVEVVEALPLVVAAKEVPIFGAVVVATVLRWIKSKEIAWHRNQQRRLRPRVVRLPKAKVIPRQRQTKRIYDQPDCEVVVSNVYLDLDHHLAFSCPTRSAFLARGASSREHRSRVFSLFIGTRFRPCRAGYIKTSRLRGATFRILCRCERAPSSQHLREEWKVLRGPMVSTGGEVATWNGSVTLNLESLPASLRDAIAQAFSSIDEVHSEIA